MSNNPLPNDPSRESIAPRSAENAPKTTMPFAPDTPATAETPTRPPEAPSADSEPPNEWRGSVSTEDGWRALGVSVRGFDHADDNTYRDDAAALAVVGPWLICAVADGVGSAKLSRFGAREAVNAAVARITEGVRLLTTPADDSQLSAIMNAAMTAALSALRGEAERRKRPLSEFATTLLLVIHGHAPDSTQLVVAAQVGDGAIAAFAPGDEESSPLAYVQLGTPDEGHAGGEIIPFNALSPSVWPKRIMVRRLPAETSGVLLLTDGVSDAFKPWYRHLWRLMAFLREHAVPVASADDALAQLRSTMNFERPGMGDDRTVILVHGPSQPS